MAFGGARANIACLALKEGAKVEPLVDTRVDPCGAALSPDGRFVAYQADEYQPHPDRKRVLLTCPADVMSSGTVRVVTRWFDDLRAQMTRFISSQALPAI